MCEGLKHRLLRDAGLLSENGVQRKAIPDVFCKKFGSLMLLTHSRTILGRRRTRVKISILNKISIVSCNILKQSVLASTNRVLEV